MARKIESVAKNAAIAVELPVMPENIDVCAARANRAEKAAISYRKKYFDI